MPIKIVLQITVIVPVSIGIRDAMVKGVTNNPILDAVTAVVTVGVSMGMEVSTITRDSLNPIKKIKLLRGFDTKDTKKGLEILTEGIGKFFTLTDDILTFFGGRRISIRELIVHREMSLNSIDVADGNVLLSTGAAIFVDGGINAFVHRQIESRQAGDIAIYKSFIDIYSFGLFWVNYKPEDFIHRIIKPPRRNPLITKTLYYSRDMESMAIGIRRIASECDAAGVKYEFIKEEYGFTVRFYRQCGEGWGENSQFFSLNNQTDVSWPSMSHDRVHDEADGARDRGHDATDRVHDEDYDKINMILEFCNIPRTRQEIMDYMRLSSRGQFKERYLKPLLESGKLFRTIPDKPKSKYQKYGRRNNSPALVLVRIPGITCFTLRQTCG